MHRRTLLVASGMLLWLSPAAQAHSGGLDASGCHTNRKTGEYHCHRAPSAPASRPAAPRPAASSLPAAGPVALISVGDGDSIRVRAAGGQPITIRLACIDAPETAQRPHGAEATAALRKLLAAGSVQIRPQTVDRYGRTVAEVFAGGRNVNLEMVRIGAAFVYHQYLRDCDANAYKQAERQAQQSRRGVWMSAQGLERPWDFRRRTRNR